MKTRALTASEATARLKEIGYSFEHANYIQDNEYTKPYGETTFNYINPCPNTFGPDLIYWETVGVRYAVMIREDRDGNSNISLFRFNGNSGYSIANYNKMKAAEKKAFMEMLENAVIVEYPEPQRIRDGFKEASYKDAMGVCHTAWYDRDGNFCEFKDRERYLNFYPGEHYEYNAKPIIIKK